MIGIATYYTPINYGAVLQAYAMQEAIKELKPKEDVGIIEYCPNEVIEDYKLINTKSLKGVIVSGFNYIANIKRRSLFKNFVNERLNVIKNSEYRTISKVILGSDQIWNPNISRGFDPMFFGIMSDGLNRKVSSYAASIGVSSLTEEQMQDFRHKIKHVSYVSVRENSAKAIIESIDKTIPVSVDLDPTLLLDSKKWKEIASDYAYEKPYVFVYSLSGYPETYTIAKRIAKHYKAEVIEVTVKNQRPFRKVDHRLLKCVSPEMFLGMIKRAEAIVTDSFHGTVFSLVFHKSMYVIPNKTKGSRMIELLRSVNLENRIMSNIDREIDYKSINFDYVDLILKNKVSESKHHLSEALNDTLTVREDIDV